MDAPRLRSCLPLFVCARHNAELKSEEVAVASDTKIASRIQSVADARYLAARRVPKGIFQMFESGDGPRLTWHRNTQVFQEVMFRPRVAVFHPKREMRTTLLGHEISMPVILSSVGFLAAGHKDGEAGVARASGAAGTIQFVSGVSSTPIEMIMAAASGPVFYQLYYVGGREASAPVIERVKRAGVSALVLTVDMPTPGEGPEIPYRDRGVVPPGTNLPEAIGFTLQAMARPAWLVDYLRGRIREPQAAMALRPDGNPMAMFEAAANIYKGTPTWEDIPWIRERWGGPIVVKGILTVEDARRAVDEGVSAIVVSNHGGNSLDGAVPTLRLLPEIVDAVGDQIEVLMDSGVRRGSDVVKALALGAKAVCLGRAYVYPLLAAGEPGVRRILELFRQGIDHTLAFLGVQSIHDLDLSCLDLPASWARVAPDTGAVNHRRDA
jgi:isopentenyl diphosphate isomerase/L-lactate dehydrogenase-like FMN-dependent dehydrogenase